MQDASADYGTVVPQGSAALIVGPDGTMELVIPRDAEENGLPLPMALLLAVLLKADDAEWLDEMIKDLETINEQEGKLS